VSLGTTEQEGSSFLERETEQHESPSLRNFQERSFRTLSQRSAQDVESKETTDETVINTIICLRLKTREVKKTRTLKTSEWVLHMNQEVSLISLPISGGHINKEQQKTLEQQ
jgi:hypothetical protein